MKMPAKILMIGFLLVQALGLFSSAWAKPLHVCATTPDLGSLLEEIGRKNVNVIVFAKGTEDPHFVEPKPSFIKELNRADLFVQNGLGLEAGWVPMLLQNARNRRVLRGGEGYLDASQAVTPLGVPAGVVDRTLGDVHPQGNPHYLLDPLNGLRVARLIQERLSRLRPGQAELFRQSYVEFSKKLGQALVGAKLADQYDIEKLARLFAYGKLEPFLRSQKEEHLLSGWFKRMGPFMNTPVIVDHNNWVYFTHRMGLKVSGSLEAKPGISPSTRHLRKVVSQMKEEEIRLIFSSAYYSPRYAQFVGDKTGANILLLANQVNSRPNVTTYSEMIDYNMRTLVDALKKHERV